MEFLDQLGEEQTKVVMRHGTKRVFFETEIVEDLATVETTAPENTRVVIRGSGLTPVMNRLTPSDRTPTM